MAFLENLGKQLKKTAHDTGTALDPTSKMSGSDRLKSVARGQAAVGTVGLSELLLNEDVQEGIATGLSGKAKVQKPGKSDPLFAGTTAEEADKIRGTYDAQKESALAANLKARGDMKTREDAVRAEGDALVEGVRQAYSDVNLPEMTSTKLQRTAAPERATFNRGAIGDVDTSAITGQAQVGPAQVYVPGEGAQYMSSLAEQLAAQARGEGPSIAAQTGQRNREAALAASLAQQASLRGGFDPAAARQIRQSAADLQAQTARDEMTARMQEQLNAQTALGDVSKAIEQTGQVAGEQQIASTGQQIDQRGQDINAATAAVEADLKQRGQDIQMEQYMTTLSDTQNARAAEMELEQNLKQADLDSIANSANFNAAVNLAMTQAAAITGALQTAYSGNTAAMREDINDFNSLVVDAMRQGQSIEAAKQQFERELIAEGKDERLAKIMADNAYRASMTAYHQAVADRQAGVIQGGMKMAQAGAQLAMGMPPTAAAGVGQPPPSSSYAASIDTSTGYDFAGGNNPTTVSYVGDQNSSAQQNLPTGTIMGGGQVQL